MTLTETIEQRKLDKFANVEVYNAKEQKIIGSHNQILERIYDDKDELTRKGKRTLSIEKLRGTYRVGNENYIVTPKYISDNLINVGKNEFENLDKKLKKELVGYVLHCAEQRGRINNYPVLKKVSEEMAANLGYHDLNGIYSLSAKLIKKILIKEGKTTIKRKENKRLLPNILSMCPKNFSFLGKIKRFFFK